MEIYCHYIDTCMPDYLDDHHNRDNELLLCGAATQPDIIAVIDELFGQATESERLTKSINNKQIKTAIALEFNRYKLHQVCIDDNMSDDIYIYAYLTWSDSTQLPRN